MLCNFPRSVCIIFFFQKVVLSFVTYSPPTLICTNAFKNGTFYKAPSRKKKLIYIYIYIDERVYNFSEGNNYFAKRNKFGMKWNSSFGKKYSFGRSEKNLKNHLAHKQVLCNNVI